MTVQEYRELLAPLFPAAARFKGFQVVWFIYNGGIEKGVIKRLLQPPSTPPKYTIAVFDDELKLHLLVAPESAIFSSLEDLAKWCAENMTESHRYHTLKHYQKYYAGIDDNMGVAIDEYLASKMI